uniref:Uncharacterized protein n=1 Tax=Physcomitrium patens TaxID=3218 RepID=A0A2K1IMD0_PHYPA|nr:hypothetical protein PHYPA_026753 [Physcomitrium patens]
MDSIALARRGSDFSLGLTALSRSTALGFHASVVAGCSTKLLMRLRKCSF